MSFLKFILCLIILDFILFLSVIFDIIRAIIWAILTAIF